MSDAYIANKQPIEDRELRKFKPDVNGDVAVNVVGETIESLLQDIANNTGGSTVTNKETLQFSGSVNTTPIDIPGAPTGDILQIIFSCLAQSPSSKRLQFSLDGGVTYFTLTPGSMIGWEPNGISQVKIKGNTSGVLYDVIINRVVP